MFSIIRLNIFFLLLGIILLPSFLFSQDEKKQDNENIQTAYKNFNQIFPVFTEPKVRLSYQRNYFLLMGSPAKFQMSFKYKLFFDKDDPDQSGFYLAYTHLAMWHLTDYSEPMSNPFVDNNYQPEFYYLFDFNQTLPWYSLKVGFKHDSNGMGGREYHNSVAWDHLYVENQFYFHLTGAHHLFIFLRAWIPLEIDDNPDILQYYGIGSLTFLYKTIFADRIGLEVELMLRKGLSKNLTQGAIQLIVSLGPFFTEKSAIPIGLVFEIWNGYGETLRFYKTSYTKLRLGLSLLLF